MISDALKVSLIKLAAAQRSFSIAATAFSVQFSYCFLQGSTSSLSTLIYIFLVLTCTLPMPPDIQRNLWWKRTDCSVLSMASC